MNRRLHRLAGIIAAYDYAALVLMLIFAASGQLALADFVLPQLLWRPGTPNPTRRHALDHTAAYSASLIVEAAQIRAARLCMRVFTGCAGEASAYSVRRRALSLD